MDCQKQSNGDAPWDVYIQPALAIGANLYVLQGDIYTHRRGAFSVARFDNPGNAKAFTAWNEHQTGSTFFCVYVRELTYGVCQSGAD